MFNNQHYCTSGISNDVPLIVQIILWQLIDEMKAVDKDYFQVFNLSEYNGRQKIVHSQELPEYSKEYLITLVDVPIYTGKIYVIDSEIYSTMLKPEEY